MPEAAATHAAGRARRRVAALLLLAVLAAPLAIGVATFGDYGMAWDEHIQRALGRQAWRYVFEDRPGYLYSHDRFYGVAYEMTLFGFERALGLGADTRPVYLMRHLVNFAVFWAAGLAVFDLVRRRLGSTSLGLLAFVLLFTAPRLYADAFYNTKDLAFLSFFAIGLWTLDRFVDRPTLARGLLHGLACGYATDVRLAGALLPALTALAFAMVEPGRGRSGRPRRLAALTACAATAAIALVAFWPYLWGDPVRRFIESVRRMAHYPWPGQVLFAGELHAADALPSSYLPVWIAITTPLGLLPMLALGLARALRESLPGGAAQAHTRAHRLVLLLSLGAPLALVIGLGSVLYDGWRQLYFLYPPMVLLACLGVQTAWQAASARAGRLVLRATAAVALAGLTASTLSATLWMVRWHPHQNLYFNAAAGGAQRISSRFDLDYWGLSCRPILEQVLAADPRPSLAVLIPTDACWQNLRLFRPADRNRIHRVPTECEADWVVAHYRHLRPGPDLATLSHRVVVDGLLVASARRSACRPR